jgi:hypothetical protein
VDVNLSVLNFVIVKIKKREKDIPELTNTTVPLILWGQKELADSFQSL